MAGNVNVSGQLLSVPGGPLNIGPFSLAPNADDLTETITFTFASPSNIFVPNWAKGMIFIPPADNVDAIILKGVTGDTGFSVGRAAPSIISFDGTTTQTIWCDMTSGSVVTMVFF